MTKLSSDLERKLLTAVDDMTSHVLGGSSPTDALYKVASELKLMPPFIRLVGNSYNTGEAAMHRETNSSVLEKLAHFPLADAEEVIGRMYPSDHIAPNEKAASTAISGEYDSAPSTTKKEWLEKFARMREVEFPAMGVPTDFVDGWAPDYGDILQRKYNAVHNLRSDLERSKQGVFQTQRLWEESLGEVVGYFKQASIDRKPLYEVESNVTEAMGDNPLVSGIFNYVGFHSRAPEGRATEKVASMFARLDWNEAPYSSILKACKAAEAYSKAILDHRTAFKTAVNRSTNLLDEQLPAPKSAPRSPMVCKTASESKKIDTSYTGTILSVKEAFERLPATLQHSMVSVGDPGLIGDMTGISANNMMRGPFDILQVPKQANYKERAKELWSLDHNHDGERSGTLEIPCAHENLKEGSDENTSYLAMTGKSPLLGEKAAIGFWGATLASYATGKARDFAEKQDKAQQALVQDYQDKLSDPDQASKLRQMRAQANINALVAGDPVLQNHGPEEISQAYNEVISMSPRAAEQPLLLAPLLRKRLEQEVLEPFESTEALKAEKGILSTHENPKINLDEG